MLIARRLIRRGECSGTDPLDTVTLDRAGRHKRRVRLTTDGGCDLLVDLAEATYFADGDAFEVEGGVITVKAAAEPVLEIHCPNALALARIAWHLGNRHTPAEVTETAIYIGPDHVMAQMVEQLGAHVHQVMRPFEPLRGAYEGQGQHARSHDQHAHHHGHDHSHEG